MSQTTSAVGEYFSNIWQGIITTVKGMALTGRYFVSPKVTMMYPEERPQIPKGHRGKHTYNEDACNYCTACQAACPVDCIAIKALGKGKDRLILEYDIDYSKCLFCNLCCEACKTGCLYLGEEYDLSAASRAGCVIHFASAKRAEEIEAHKQMLEKKEAERKAKLQAAQQQASQTDKSKSE